MAFGMLFGMLFALLAFSPDRRMPAGSGTDRTVRLWNMAKGKALAVRIDRADCRVDRACSAPAAARRPAAARSPSGP
ncbi:hypothetical protein [Sinosporangium siamense]|uniref:Uncharacterized protein n=1 Tax=Sinosporangium siamense TaxID=1367973 RepID=A0A919R9Z9_9ACTN|nr:hypothetical protein [Sinosporangium siamense]GII90130.1 hypothetical protein Ssi02_03610 [Sinosporangium siamense]